MRIKSEMKVLEKFKDFTQIFYHLAVVVSLFFVISKGLWEYGDRDEEIQLANGMVAQIKQLDGVIEENQEKIRAIRNEMWKNKKFKEHFEMANYELLKDYYMPSHADIMKLKDPPLMMYYVQVKTLEAYISSFKKLREEIRADLREVVGPRHLHYKRYTRSLDPGKFDFGRELALYRKKYQEKMAQKSTFKGLKKTVTAKRSMAIVQAKIKKGK